MNGTERKAFSSDQDALVAWAPANGEPSYLVGYVKRTYKIVANRLVRDEARPLVVAAHGPDCIDPIRAGIDTLSAKVAADLVVYGEVRAPDAKPVRSMTASIVHGRIEKRLSVIGDRVVERRSSPNSLRFSDPEPFEALPLDWQRSYGGIDLEVEVPEEHLLMMAAGMPLDHPGFYPRNPLGRGYYVVDCERDEPMLLPNFEDPEARLTESDFFTRDPSAWWRRPLPWNFAPTYMRMFPRHLLADAAPWFPVPIDARLAEVERSFFDPAWLIDDGANDAFERIFQQEAAFGLWVVDPSPGTPIELRGMSFDGQPRRFALPEPPRIRFELEGRRHDALGRLLSIEVHPNDELVHMTWAAVNDAPHRLYLPGVHAEIPLSMLVDESVRVPYDTPRVITATG